MPGTNSGLGGFMNGASIRFSKFKGGGLGRDSAMLAAAGNKYGTARPRTTGQQLPKLHSIHSGTVVSMQPFGAFVQLGDGGKYKDGLLHVSCLCAERVESPEQAGLEQGMKVWVKVSEIKEEDGKYSLDLRYVNQLDGADLDPYQAKGKLPDNNFAPAGSRSAARRPVASGAEAGRGGRFGDGTSEPMVTIGGGPSQLVRSTALAAERNGTPTAAAAVERGPPAEEEYEKVMRKLEKARNKLEHARKKEEKLRRSELEKEKGKKKSKEERREEKEGKRDRRDDEVRGRQKATRREEVDEEEEKLDRKFKQRKRRREEDDSDS